jgi:undecaprenyl-diphosphatase
MGAAMGTLDLWLFHLVNDFAGNWFLDRLVNFVEGNALVRSLPLILPLWYYWFEPDPKRDERRNLILRIIVGCLVALLINRTIAGLAPFRPRPMYTADIGFHEMSLRPVIHLVGWNSFPSDNATFSFALATGVFFLSRWLGTYLFLHAAVFVCLPRIYQGIHYPSDIIVGALIGIIIMAPLLRVRDWLPTALMWRFSKARVGLFTTVFLLATFEMAVTFDDLRGIVDGAVHLYRAHAAATQVISSQ